MWLPNVLQGVSQGQLGRNRRGYVSIARDHTPTTVVLRARARLTLRRPTATAPMAALLCCNMRFLM